MKLTKQAIKEILQHVKKVTEDIKGEQIEQLMEKLISARRVFVYGTGRSGLVSKAFAIRLAHLGIEVFAVGDTITPPIGKGDVLFCVSGSGKTESVVLLAKTAKKLGAKVISITSDTKSSLAKISDIVLRIKGRTKNDILKEEKDYLAAQIKGKDSPLSPMGTLFEDSCLLFLDGVVVELMNRIGKTEKDMRKRHMNME
ncbi:MAG: 6-phospho-3-hexuloisomerase [Candidatus Aenigmarchaeota archaeon]|nr:6-phospho-3-hexuloisomerase [Candidatus Aenigmarchaeota archaeon]